MPQTQENTERQLSLLIVAAHDDIMLPKSIVDEMGWRKGDSFHAVLTKSAMILERVHATPPQQRPRGRPKTLRPRAEPPSEPETRAQEQILTPEAT